MSESADTRQVANFLSNCVEHGGGVAEWRGPDILDALLPDRVAESLNGRSIVTLALNPDLLATEPEAELATPGSPVMDAFINFASDIGMTSFGTVRPSHVRSKGLREEVSRMVTYRHCRLRQEEDFPKVRDAYYCVFYFRVEYISDERREQVIASAIDLTTMRANHEFAAAIPRLLIETDAAPSEDWLVPNRLVKAYDTAYADLLTQVQTHSATLLATATKRLEVESLRLSEYYQQMEAELTKRRQKETDTSRQNAIADKIAIARAENERKVLELSEKYRIRPRAKLTTVILIRQPKTYFDILVDRGPRTRRVTFAFDSLLDRLELPTCDRCRLEMTVVTVSADGEHLCEACCG